MDELFQLILMQGLDRTIGSSIGILAVALGATIIVDRFGVECAEKRRLALANVIDHRHLDLPA